MKIHLLISYLSYASLALCLDDTWFAPNQDLVRMEMCPLYWKNGSNYLCDGRPDRLNYVKYEETGVKKCRCDESCHQYQDCCLDKSYLDPKNETTRIENESCLPLPGSLKYKVVGIYMVNKCGSDWDGDFTKYLCEEDSDLADLDNSNVLTYTVPVHSDATGSFYRNVYCAACNFDNTNLTQWNFTSLNYDNVTYSDDVNINVTGDGQWLVKTRGKESAFLIDEFRDWPVFYETYQPRPCLLEVVSTCTNKKSVAARHCPKYLAPVYVINRKNIVNVIYKNFHCAVCNDDVTNKINRKLVCEDYDGGIKYPHVSSQSFNNKHSVKMLLDFNFARGIHIREGVQCADGEAFNSVLDRCVAISCGKLYVEKGNRCVLKSSPSDVEKTNETDALVSDCRKARILPHEFVVLMNKSIVLKSGKTLYPGQYEVSVDGNGTWINILICTDQLFKIIDFSDAQQLLSQICLPISVLCLCLHLATYCILPTLRNLPGKTLMSMSFSLATADTLFLIGSNFDTRPSVCHIIGVLKHYAYLAVFFWTNIMAADIHRTFSRTSVYRASSSNKTFVRYSVYAWCSPGVIVLVAVLVDTFLKDNVCKPHYGHGICWISQRPALLIFFAVPMAVLLVINAVLFVLTARNISATTKQTKMVKRFSDKIRFVLYVKLATVLGLTWVFGFLAAVANVDVLWYPFILFTGLQGVIIFVAFTCKRKIWTLLRQRFTRKATDAKRGGYLREKSNMSTARSMATSATSLSTASWNKIEQMEPVKSTVTPPRHPRVDYIRVNSE